MLWRLRCRSSMRRASKLPVTWADAPILAKNGYSVEPVPPGMSRPIGAWAVFQGASNDASDGVAVICHRLSTPHSGLTAVKAYATHVVCLVADIRDTKLAAEVDALVAAQFSGPVRTRAGSSERLRPFRVAFGEGSRLRGQTKYYVRPDEKAAYDSDYEWRGNHVRLDIGDCFMVSGYDWSADLRDVTRDELPLLTAPDAEAMFLKIETLLESRCSRV